MITKTSGIVIHSTKYSDNAIIVTLFTQALGVATFMIYYSNNKKSKFKPAFFQPLTIVEIEALQKPNKEIHNLKDIRIKIPLNTISSNPVKNAIAMFIAELLYRSLNHTDTKDNTYDFLENSIQVLDYKEEDITDFHLVFMTKLSRYLGFEPNLTNIDFEYFDMLNGIFVQNTPQHSHWMNKQITILFKNILATDLFHRETLTFNREQRNILLDNLLDYYKLHIPNFIELKSLNVLHELFE